MTDFFVSYTSADQEWAEWVAFTLEEEGFSAIIQAWDFRPGSNFVLEMQSAASRADRTILILSPDYLKSQFAAPEWAASFTRDPEGLQRKLIPIMIRNCNPDGLLRSIVHINLLNLDEAAAREQLIQGVKVTRAKPSHRPKFPGSTKQASQKSFPGEAVVGEQAPHSGIYVPKVNRSPSDVEKRQFIKQAFDSISSHFQSGLAVLSEQNSAIEHDFELTTAAEFTAEIFVHGNTIARCRIWRGGLNSQNGISYAEGSTFSIGGGCNESLSLQESGNELRLSALMSTTHGQRGKSYDLPRLTKEQAADYLWRRFVEPIERGK